MEITRNTRVGDIATLVPLSIAVFERYGVDICSKGDLPLEEAVRAAGLSVGDILAEIERELQAAEEEDRLHAHMAAETPGSLADHIREVHHGYLHTHLPSVGEHFVPALLTSGDACDALYETAREFDRLRRMLLTHLADEERDILPLIRVLSTEGGNADVDRTTIAATLTAASKEHETVLNALRTIGALIDDCAPDAGGRPDYPELFRELRALEVDVQRHIKLEDEVLFPAIRRLAGI